MINLYSEINCPLKINKKHFLKHKKIIKNFLSFIIYFYFLYLSFLTLLKVKKILSNKKLCLTESRYLKQTQQLV